MAYMNDREKSLQGGLEKIGRGRSLWLAIGGTTGSALADPIEKRQNVLNQVETNLSVHYDGLTSQGRNALQYLAP